MGEPGEIKIINHEGVVPRVITNVTHQSVAYYNDVVDYMAQAAVRKYEAEAKQKATPAEIDFLKKELVRYVIIRKDLKTAQQLTIKPRVRL
jgi:transposase